MYAVLRLSKLKTAGAISGLNAHLERTMPVPNADPTKSHLNQRIVGSDNLNSDIQNRILEAGCKVRKDSVLAVQFILTATGEHFKDNQIEKANQFKNVASQWLVENYGIKNVVNVHLHMDEKTPHLHATVVPIDEKGVLNAKAMLGNRVKMRDMQTSFAKAVAHLGLQRGLEGSRAEHTTVKQYYGVLNKANEVRLEDPSIYEIKKPSVAEITFSGEKWAREQNELIRRSAELLKQKLKEDTVKTNLKASKELLDARGGKAFKKAEVGLKNDFNKELEAKRLKYNGLVEEYNSLLKTKNQWQEKAESLEKKYEPKIEPEKGHSRGIGM